MSALRSNDLAQLAEGARALASKASLAIMEVYQRSYTVTAKADDSPLTEADLTAHAILEHGLKALEPRFPVLSEESSARIFVDRKRWLRYWLIDPLDGTREFVQRNGEFAVNIALIEDGVPVIGIIAEPRLARMGCGVRGLGAALYQADGSNQVLRTVPHAQPLRIGMSRSHHPAELERSLSLLGDREPVVLGSSLKFLSIAEGNMDLYPRLRSSSSEWDIAAGQGLLEAAGGAVLGLDGAPLRYNQRDSLTMPAFVAFGDPSQDWLARLGWHA